MQDAAAAPGRDLPLALAILEREHADIDQAFERLENAGSAAERESARTSLAAAVERHLALEEAVFYPALDRAEGLASMRRRGEGEHAELREAMASLGDESADNGGVRLARRVFERHRRGEEDEVFPLVQRCLADGLPALALELEQQREAERGAYGVG